MRELLEERIEELVDAYFDAARNSVVVAKYEGEVIPSDVIDYTARIAVYERLLDRVYGKPRQALELAAEDGSETPLIVAVDGRELSDATRDFLARLIPS
jgi:hypothetical protein